MDERQPEHIRREIANQHRDDLDIDSAQAITPWPPRRAVGWHCQHMNITAGGVLGIGPVSTGCGCQMEPVYAA